MKKTQKQILILCLLSYGVFAGFLYEHGQVTCTEKNGWGCICHDEFPSADVQVWVEGPKWVPLNTPTLFEIYVSGGPAVAAGFNVAAGRAALDPYDTTSQLIDDELTHTFPQEFGTDTVVSWKFYFVGTSPGEDTLFSVANSVNGNHEPTGDQWNFGQMFIVNMGTMAVGQEQRLPRPFRLEQNFPNPFNPSTTIRFHTRIPAWARVRVYNVLGREITVLLDEFKKQGSYEIVWNAENIPSGLYFCQLTINGFSDIKKMIVMK